MTYLFKQRDPLSKTANEKANKGTIIPTDIENEQSLTNIIDEELKSRRKIEKRKIFAVCLCKRLLRYKRHAKLMQLTDSKLAKELDLKRFLQR